MNRPKVVVSLAQIPRSGLNVYYQKTSLKNCSKHCRSKVCFKLISNTIFDLDESILNSFYWYQIILLRKSRKLQHFVPTWYKVHTYNYFLSGIYIRTCPYLPWGFEKWERSIFSYFPSRGFGLISALLIRITYQKHIVCLGFQCKMIYIT